MFSRVRSKTSGSSLLVEELLDLVGERAAARARTRSPSRGSLGESDEPSGLRERPATRAGARRSGDDAARRAGRSMRGVVEAELVARAPRAVCSPTHGHARLGALGHLRQLHRVAGDEHRLARRRRCAASRRACCARRRAGRRSRPARGLLGPATMPAAVSSRAASSFVRCDAHASTAGRITSRGAAPSPRASRSAGRPSTPGARRARRAASNWCSRTICIDDLAVGRRGSPRRSPASALSGSGRTPSDQKFVTMSVIATIASNIAMSTYWPSPVRSRWRSAARMPITREQRGADVAERADRDRHAAARRGWRVVVDARHRLDDRRVRGPVAVRRLDRVAEARDRHVDRRGCDRGDRRRSRGPCDPSCRA